MKIKIDDEFKALCKKIVNMNLKIDQWNNIESDDMFQTTNYEGGYDAIEQAFCFSFYDKQRNEYWIQISLDQMQDILVDKLKYIEARLPD